MERRVDIGIVGAGRIASAYVEAARASARVRIAAVCDVRPDAATRLGEECGARVFADHRPMLSSIRLDGLLICTPPASHAALMHDAIAAGVPVLCEKPFTIAPDDAVAVLAAAAERGVLVSMASKFRYVPEIAEAKRLLAAGALGRLALFENEFSAVVDMSGRWNADPRHSGGGVLIDNGSHAFDLAAFFGGPLERVRAVAGPRARGLAVEETAHVAARAVDGAISRLDLSWSRPSSGDAYVRLSGDAGSVVVGWQGARYRAHDGDWVRLGGAYSKTAALRAQIEDFAGAVCGEPARLLTADEALASVRAVAAAYSSIECGRAVPVRPGPGEAPRRPQADDR